MTLDYTKMFLIVTEEAVVKGHFIGMHRSAMRARLGSSRYAIGYRSVRYIFRPERGVIFCAFLGGCCAVKRPPCVKGAAERSEAGGLTTPPAACSAATSPLHKGGLGGRPMAAPTSNLGKCCVGNVGAVMNRPCGGWYEFAGIQRKFVGLAATTPPAACSADTSLIRGRLGGGAKSSEGRLWRAIIDRPYIITGGWRGNGTSRAGNR